MSKPDYKKKIMNLLKEGAILTVVPVGLYATLKYIFMVLPPCTKLDISDVAKLGSGIVGAIVERDYYLHQNAHTHPGERRCNITNSHCSLQPC